MTPPDAAIPGWMRGVAIAVILVGVFVACVDALLTYSLLSTGDAGDRVTPLLTLQLVLALAGIAPAAVTIYAIVRRHLILGIVCFVLTAAVYAAWGTKNEAALNQRPTYGAFTPR